MNALPEKVFTAHNQALTPVHNEAFTLIKNQALTPVQNEALTLIKNQALTPVQNEDCTLIKNQALTPVQNETLTLVQNQALTQVQNEAFTLVQNEAPAEACSSCQVCGEPGPVFECPACNSNLCCECYDMCQLAHWGDSDTRREQLAGIKGGRP